MKKIISIIIALMVVFLIGGCSKMTGTPSKQEMIKVVKSEEAKRVIEETLKNLEKNALTDEGVIKNYEVDYSTVRYNPMGGIMFKVIINNDPEMTVTYILDKPQGKLENSDGSPSVKLYDKRGGKIYE